MSDILRNVLPHLRTQFERGRAVLFTGAGFSVGAKNIEGEDLPGAENISRKIWELCFPSDPFDSNAKLQDIYEVALNHRPRDLSDLLTRSLTVDTNSIPDWIRLFFDQPWYRVYTLNIDTLAQAVSRRFPIRRQFLEISGSGTVRQKTLQSTKVAPLEVIYLNGMLADVPNNVTFSTTQYARRLVPDSLYQQLSADLVSRPVIFIGSKLDESPLWQNIEIRQTRGIRGLREMRPRSYLVIPSLDKAKETRLADLHVMWIPMTSEQFAHEVLATLSEATEKGFSVLSTVPTASTDDPRIFEVADLATGATQASDYLLGEEPIWADIQAGRAVERDCDSDFWDIYQKAKSLGKGSIIIITGTAGVGKSTCLMRLALRISAEGNRIAWIDRDTGLSPRHVLSALRDRDAPSIIAIDDGDLFGYELSHILREIIVSNDNALIIIAVRSGVVDRVINTVILKDITIAERAVPNLADRDVNALIDVLDRENRLGALKGKTREQQRKVFLEYSGRQLLVAMISATSGRQLEEKVYEEFADLDNEAKQLYALLALATTFRHSLSRQDILIALNDSTNAALNTIDVLLRRHIIAERPPNSDHIQARHRVIADLLRSNLEVSGQITNAVFGLTFVAATKLPQRGSKNSRALALLRQVINHDFLLRTLGLEQSKLLYENIENLLANYSHYWLQRGSLEVECGDLRLAENFLSQARGLTLQEDAFIENEWAYLLFCKALQNPRASEASTLVQDATEILERIIQDKHATPHPFHVLGSQGLAWSRAAISNYNESARYLRGLLDYVQTGCERYPRNKDLLQLRNDLQREYLSRAVPSHLAP
jgi:Mrp family chromosome partitioning ATPase